MSIAAHWGMFLRGSPPVETAEDSMFRMVCGACSVFISPGGGDLPLRLSCLLYCLAMCSMWWPVCFRVRPELLWLCRFASLGMLASWYFVHDDYHSLKPPPGCGDIVWAVGSTLIGLSVWLTSPRKIVATNSSETIH